MWKMRLCPVGRWLWLLVAVAAVSLPLSHGWSQQSEEPAESPAEESPAAEPAPAADGAASGEAAADDAEAPQFRGRLPDYYGQVVDDGQRQRIYAIQEEYAPRIAELRAQLEKLVQERNARIEAVLTTQELEEVRRLRAAARRARQQQESP